MDVMAADKLADIKTFLKQKENSEPFSDEHHHLIDDIYDIYINGRINNYNIVNDILGHKYSSLLLKIAESPNDILEASSPNQSSEIMSIIIKSSYNILNAITCSKSSGFAIRTHNDIGVLLFAIGNYHYYNNHNY